MNNNVKGFGISFVFHGALLYGLLSMTTLLPATNMTKIIDFSLVEHPDAPQKEPSKIPPSFKAVPAREPVVKKPLAAIVSKISVPPPKEAPVAEQEMIPPPESLPEVAEKIEENRSEEVVEEVQVAPLAETITAAAPAAESHDQTAEPTAPDIADAGQIKEIYVQANLHFIKDHIQKGISYPRLARKMSWEGKVIVSFVVGRDGMVQDVHIVESSGFAALDKNAIATIIKAAPYPCPPVKAELVVPVIYRLA